MDTIIINSIAGALSTSIKPTVNFKVAQNRNGESTYASFTIFNIKYLYDRIKEIKKDIVEFYKDEQSLSVYIKMSEFIIKYFIQLQINYEYRNIINYQFG